MDFTNITAGTILGIIFGPGGVLVVGVYIFWLGQKGNWLFAAVHDKIVAQYESRLAEANKRVEEADARTAAANARADRWQHLYLESKHIVDASTTVAASLVNSSQQRGQS